MGHQGRQNCDNLKWLYMVAFVKKTKTKTQFQEPLQDPSLQLTQSICIKPSYATLSMLPHNYLHGDKRNTDPERTGSKVNNNNGIDIWNKLVSMHENVKLVVCGHQEYNRIIMAQSNGKPFTKSLTIRLL